MKFTDGRSNKMCFVSYCILNSNSLYNGSNTLKQFPAFVGPIMDFLFKNGIGVEQMPCMEQQCFGLNHNLRFKDEMDSPKFRKYCEGIAKAVTAQIEHYRKCGVKTLFILGKYRSPCCGVTATAVKGYDKLEESKGIFFEELEKCLKRAIWMCL